MSGKVCPRVRYVPVPCPPLVRSPTRSNKILDGKYKIDGSTERTLSGSFSHPSTTSRPVRDKGVCASGVEPYPWDSPRPEPVFFPRKDKEKIGS